MEQIILVVHLLLALAIIGLIMLQQGKGAEMGASFGAGASQTIFGSDGTGNVLSRATGWLAVLFFASSFGLALIATEKTQVVRDDIGLDIPVQRAAPEPISDLPEVEDEIPSLSAPDAALEGAEGDLPELAPEAPALEDDLPQLQ
ncbi:MAG: preprotein translocase subunit SecG [Pseudomonadota bacterium]